MKKVVWLSDIHLNFLSADKVRNFISVIHDQDPDVVLLGGDISDSRYLITHLRLIEMELDVPIYFVLGNHDFYHSSFAQVQQNITDLTQHSSSLQWLTKMDIVELTPATALIGHDSWADGRFGDYYRSSLMLNDYFLIEELTNLDEDRRSWLLNYLGDVAARHFERLLPLACQSYQEILLLTHVPPFREACWHEGQISDDNGLPHFSCKAVGDVLCEVMRGCPQSDLTVLCGHTHSSGVARILPNLTVFTGEAEYAKPTIQKVFEIE